MPRPCGLNNPPLLLLSRPECGLCDEFEQQLAALAREMSLPQVLRIDVDSNPEYARRYGLDIPVLLWDGMKVCQHHLDADELRRLLRAR